jgi:hypothetical protein
MIRGASAVVWEKNQSSSNNIIFEAQRLPRRADA